MRVVEKAISADDGVEEVVVDVSMAATEEGKNEDEGTAILGTGVVGTAVFETSDVDTTVAV